MTKWKRLFLAVAIAWLASSCASGVAPVTLPLPAPLPPLADESLDCVSEDTFRLVIRYRERVKTLEEIIKSTVSEK